MKFISTRDASASVGGLQAIVYGISKKDGGLYVPSSFPKISLHQILDLLTKEYYERAAYIIHMFLDEFSLDELTQYCKMAYSKFDDEQNPAPLIKTDDNSFMLELWHGPTCAFKDMALTLLPYLLAGAKKKLGIDQTTLILTATSGDTGKAALEGFCDVEGTKIMVVYPDGGVSDIQRLQMVTSRGDNISVVSLEGNFDDAQTAVKQIFADDEVAQILAKSNIALSSANSINFGRLLPQIVYYFSAYIDLIAAQEISIGDEVNFCVPTGNFGNILAGWYAKKMGLPISTLICASNRNNVLTQFIDSGKYDRNREFYKTVSPSMDILISSNLERLVFELSGRNDELTAQRMQGLDWSGNYVLGLKELKALQADFFGGFTDELQTQETIKTFNDEYGYLCDPHTAVAVSVLNDYLLETNDDLPTIIISTASPYKFAQTVLRAINSSPAEGLTKTFKKLARESGTYIPDSLEGLDTKKVIFDKKTTKEQLKNCVLEFAKE